ncbi:SHC-transforming protein 1-like isoform X2 [Oppia nitens]|nr:SHC-transforming protein 1-like isoform X2 [Oppia nitens]
MTSSITNKSNQSYITKYVGCLGINTSMKSLDFDTRSQIAKECINRVCELGRLKTPDKKRRPEKRIHKMLADTPNMEFAGVDVNLVITSSYLHLTTIETGEVIAKHEMPNISFASRGDADTIDFVSYVAKDHRYGRACFVLECGGGLAHDVITAIGQAFELRFKEFLNRSPRTTSVNEILESAVPNGLCHTINNNFNTDNDSKNRLDERDYYNDLPGKIPPDVPPVETNSKTSLRDCSSTQRVPQAAPRTAIKKSNEQNSPNLIDLNIDIQDHINTTQSESSIIDPNTQIVDHQYVNCSTDDSNNNNNQNKTDNSNNESVIQTAKDPFDMKPFNSALAEVTTDPLKANCSQTTTTTTKSTINCKLEQEEWFHGPISRKESETLVVKDGDFLVRESQGSVGQYVLTGMQSGFRKHLLLVDPEGVVRTKDKTFESVSHLINYHRNNGLPIISAESALLLRNPVLVKR